MVRLRRLIDINIQRCTCHLASLDRSGKVVLIDDAAAWKVGPVGTQLIDLPSGPRIAHADAGFIRLPAGTKFPRHRHLGDEVALILQGGYVDSSGRELRPGDVDAKATGSEHAFTVFADVDLIQLVVLEKGIEIEGMPGVSL